MAHRPRILGRRLAKLAAGILAVAFARSALALEDKLVIGTSFPEDLTGVFQAAFEAKHPGTRVEVLNKKTSAGVKYLPG